MRNAEKIIVIFTTIGYLILGLKFCSIQGFWHDEIYTLTFLKGISAYAFDGNTLSQYSKEIPASFCKSILQSDNFLSNFHLQILHEGHPPLYFIFLKLWALIFGYTELSLRSFSLLTGVLSLAVFGCLLKKYFKEAKVYRIIMLLALFNPFLFYYFTEARMYAFALLLSILTLKYWLRFKDEKEIKSLNFLYFSLTSSALLYTHYYGLFFVLSLGFYDMIKNKLNAIHLSYFIPLIIFTPWFFVIQHQTRYHKIHWTDGSYPFLKSLIGFFNGLTDLFFSPMSNANEPEFLLSIFIAIILFYFISKTWNNRLIYISIGLIYFLQLFTFDKVFDHHTIIVPRYYIFLLVFIYWAIAKSINQTPKIVLGFCISAYLITAGIIFQKIYTREVAPKQMYKELANYIDFKHDPKSTIIVVEPEGTITWGLAYYLKKDFNIITAKNFKHKKNPLKPIFIDEMLGDKYWENKLNNDSQKKLKLVPFVGVFLYE